MDVNHEYQELSKLLCLSKVDRFIISAHAIFEGVGIAGLISAAFWYTTAPIAPDGFKGPISTYTIATTTIISLFLAVPISRMAYKKLIRDMGNLYTELRAQVCNCRYAYYELLFELLKFRSIHDSDEHYLAQSRPINFHTVDGASILTMVNQRYTQLEHLPLALKGSQASIPFAELIRDKELLSSPFIKKELIRRLEEEFSQPDASIIQAQQPVPVKPWSNLFYATASGVACTEVLLSIGWTVISVLIGVDAILPISNLTWGIFAAFCIFAGILFGVGMGLSRHKERKVQSIHAAYQKIHSTLNQTIDHLHQLLSEQLLIKRGLTKQIEVV